MLVDNEAFTRAQEFSDVADESVLATFLPPAFHLFSVPAIWSSYASVRIEENKLGFGDAVQRPLQLVVGAVLATTNLSGVIGRVVWEDPAASYVCHTALSQVPQFSPPAIQTALGAFHLCVQPGVGNILVVIPNNAQLQSFAFRSIGIPGKNPQQSVSTKWPPSLSTKISR